MDPPSPSPPPSRLRRVGGGAHQLRRLPLQSWIHPRLLPRPPASGVLEAVRISCAGFPSKRPFPDFVDHFWTLAPGLLRQPDLDDREISRRIMEKSGVTDYQLGTTKVRGKGRI